jgi:hypothetical protein
MDLPQAVVVLESCVWRCYMFWVSILEWRQDFHPHLLGHHSQMSFKNVVLGCSHIRVTTDTTSFWAVIHERGGWRLN